MKKWIPVMIVGGLLMGGSAYWFHSRPYTARQLVQMLPPDRAAHMFIDVGALRSSGILDLIAGSRALEDADYRKFVTDTGFDYRENLDSLAIAFRDGDVYYVAQGDFDWNKLAAYAPSHGGKCERFICKAPGSEPGRDVSYYMPRNGILALAVSRTASAGDMIAPGTWQDPPQLTGDPIWISTPPFIFNDLSKVPTGTRSFFSPLKQSTSAIFTLGPAPSNPAKNGFELRMNVTARDAAGAANLAKQYTDVTNLFVQMLERDKMTPNPDDLSGVLTSGRFTTKETQVTGTWPIPRNFLDSLASSLDVGNK
jgi:hypothetical protein